VRKRLIRYGAGQRHRSDQRAESQDRSRSCLALILAWEQPGKPIQVCPGAFPTDLTATTDCRYKMSQRSLDFVSGSLTDQALLGAVVFGLGAQIIQSPSVWKRTWEGYGYRAGSRYTQAVGKGAAEFLFGRLLNDDPRFLAYRNDPAVITRNRDAVCALAARASPGIAKPCAKSMTASLDALSHDGWKRFGHAWYDVITVRRSTIQGNGRRIPAISRFAGEFGGAYAGYPWYPGAENTYVKVGDPLWRVFQRLHECPHCFGAATGGVRKSPAAFRRPSGVAQSRLSGHPQPTYDVGHRT